MVGTTPTTLLDAVTGTGASTPIIDVSNFRCHTFHIIAASVSTGGTMDIEHSLNGTNWVKVNTTAISETGNTEFSVSRKQYKFIRANLSARTDGTYTVIMINGY